MAVIGIFLLSLLFFGIEIMAASHYRTMYSTALADFLVPLALAYHNIWQLIGWLTLTIFCVEALRVSRWKKPLVLFISCLLIAWLDIGSFFILLVFSSAIYYVVRKGIRISHAILPLNIILLGILVLIKSYVNWGDFKSVYVPLGVSYYFLRLISLLSDYSNKPKEYRDTSPSDFFLYVFFFPIFLGGPVQRFREFYEIAEKANPLPLYLKLALYLSAKIVIVDAILFHYTYKVFLPALHGYNTLALASLAEKLFLFSVTGFFHAYLDLMFYTEISKALAYLLGFSAKDNFNRPLLQTNISNYWQSWCMTLSNWTRDYIFFPILIKYRRMWLANYGAMLIIGLWHELAIKWISWALIHGTALTFYQNLKRTAAFKAVGASPGGNRFLGVSGNIITVVFVIAVFTIVIFDDTLVLCRIMFRLVGIV